MFHVEPPISTAAGAGWPTPPPWCSAAWSGAPAGSPRRLTPRRITAPTPTLLRRRPRSTWNVAFRDSVRDRTAGPGQEGI